MTHHKTMKPLLFLLALTLVMPAVQLLDTPEAEAFGLVRSSRSGGKREHKQANSRDSRSSQRSSNNAVRSSSPQRTTTTTTTRTTPRATHHHTTHHSAGSRTTYQSAPTRSRTTVHHGGTTVHHRHSPQVHHRHTTVTRTHPHTTHHTTRGRVVHRRHHYVAPAPVHRHHTTRTEVYHHTAPPVATRTEVYHHHHAAPAPVVVQRRHTTQHRYYYGSGDTSGGSTVTGTYNEPSRGFSESQSQTQGYLSVSGGMSAMAADQIATQALPGWGFDVGLGARSGWLAGELGFNMGGYRLDPAQAQSDMLLLGFNADLKLQPSFHVLEPYAMVGVGGNIFSDSVANASATGGALRLGAGLDIRLDDIALSFQYLRTQNALLGDAGLYTDGMLSAQTETIGVGLKFYF